MNLVAPHIRPQATHIVVHRERGKGFRTMCDRYAQGDLFEITGWDDIACKTCVKFAHIRHVDVLRPRPELNPQA